MGMLRELLRKIWYGNWGETTSMDQNELKKAAARAAIEYIEPLLEENTIVGVGTGSTTNCFIEELGALRNRFQGAVASSEAS
ncbi:MAG: hypothetical protein RLZZ385_940, partial [Pseudomonadota bacterium]